jgi:hypothetical protein
MGWICTREMGGSPDAVSSSPVRQLEWSSHTYFTTSSREDENLPILKDAVNWLKLRYNLPISVVRSDSEMNRNKTKAWLNDRGIAFERCAPDTHNQNGTAERMERIIMAKARAMRLSGKLPTLCGEKLYLRQYIYTTGRLEWKSPYEVFHDL